MRHLVIISWWILLGLSIAVFCPNSSIRYKKEKGLIEYKITLEEKLHCDKSSEVICHLTGLKSGKLQGNKIKISQEYPEKSLKIVQKYAEKGIILYYSNLRELYACMYIALFIFFLIAELCISAIAYSESLFSFSMLSLFLESKDNDPSTIQVVYQKLRNTFLYIKPFFGYE